MTRSIEGVGEKPTTPKPTSSVKEQNKVQGILSDITATLVEKNRIAPAFDAAHKAYMAATKDAAKHREARADAAARILSAIATGKEEIDTVEYEHAVFREEAADIQTQKLLTQRNKAQNDSAAVDQKLFKLWSELQRALLEAHDE